MDKRAWAVVLVALFGGNLTGLSGLVGNERQRDNHADLQRQLDDIKADDEELRDSMSKLADRCVDTQTALQRHNAQIEELYRHLN